MKALKALTDFSAGVGEGLILKDQIFHVNDWKPLVEAGLAIAATSEEIKAAENKAQEGAKTYNEGKTPAEGKKSQEPKEKEEKSTKQTKEDKTLTETK